MPTAGGHGGAEGASPTAVQVSGHGSGEEGGVESFSVRLQPHVREEDLVHVVEGVVEAWPCGSKATVTVISGGTTNLLYKVVTGEHVALVRVFGSGSDLLIDRERDNSALQAWRFSINFRSCEFPFLLFTEVAAALAKAGLGPPYLGKFKNGRVEGWLSAEPLTPPEAFAEVRVQPARHHGARAPPSSSLHSRKCNS